MLVARWCLTCCWDSFVVEKDRCTSTGLRSSSTDIGGLSELLSLFWTFIVQWRLIIPCLDAVGAIDAMFFCLSSLSLYCYVVIYCVNSGQCWWAFAFSGSLPLYSWSCLKLLLFYLVIRYSLSLSLVGWQEWHLVCKNYWTNNAQKLMDSE